LNGRDLLPMNMFIIDKEIWIRLGVFCLVFIVMAVWETMRPRRILTEPKGKRWAVNLSITLLNALIIRLIFPLAAVGSALIAEEQKWGLFNQFTIDDRIAGIIAILVLDFTIYAQHAMFHYIPVFWRLHMVHHTDLDIDVTTGARFHPIEILLSMTIKMSVIVLLGAPAYSVLVFEVLLNGTSMFNHSNIYIPPEIDKVIRLFVVAPDMHRVHHSVIISERNSNFSFNFSWWDRIFRTYKDQPDRGHNEMVIGLANFRDFKQLGLPHILALPFFGEKR
jgi:sterol desaturase/sphingolipid hydroxylase (fatty acid hydroxylase superfamily)